MTPGAIEGVPGADSRNKRRLPKTLLYGIYGLAIGVSVPVAGWIADHYFLFGKVPSELSLKLLKEIHRVTPIHYFIDAIPLIMTFLAMLVGHAQERILFYSEHLEDLVAQRTRELKLAKAEQDQILSSIDQGLFLVDENLIIGGQQSLETSRIFSGMDLAGSPFIKILRQQRGDLKPESTEQYLRLLYRPDLHDGVLANLNPLANFTLRANSEAGADEKHLRFSFFRVRESGKIVSVLAAVSNITAEIKLQQKVADAEAEAAARSRLIGTVLSVNPAMLLDFRETVREELANVQGLLQAAGRQPTHLLVDELFHGIHALKGNAGLLGLEIVETEAHAIEELLSALRAQTATPEALQLVPVVVRLNRLLGAGNEIGNVINKIQAYYATFSGRHQSNRDLIFEFARRAAEKAAASVGKVVHVECDYTGEADVPDGLRKVLKDTLVQLLRNAIAHGIETPADRATAGKPPAGTLKMTLGTSAGSVHCCFRDDGRGLAFDKIRSAAAATKRWLPEQLSNMTEAEIADLIFASAISTAGAIDMLSGRGVGMSLVRERLQNLGGTIVVRSEVGLFTEFQINLPFGHIDQL